MAVTPAEVKVLYAELAEMTKPLCAQCTPPFACCATRYCQFAKTWAQQRHGVTLEFVNAYEHAPFLGPGDTGCTVAPELRPMCSAFACEDVLRVQTDEWKTRYFALRNRLRRIEFAAMLGMEEEELAELNDTRY